MATVQNVRTVAVDGAMTGYCLEGPANAPVVMFSNGLATTAAMWAPQAAHFADRFRVLRYDVRGHGSTTPSSPPYTLELLADDVIHLLDRLDIGRVAYVGLSLGGMIGQVLAVRHADRIGTLVLCDTTVRNRRAMWEERIAAIEADGLEPQVEPSIARWFTPAFKATRPALMDDLREMIRTTSVSGYLGCAMAMRDMRVAETAAHISMPTLVVVGADDRSTPVADAQELHAAIPGAQLEVIAQAAHLPNIEQADQFNARLERFLTAPAA